MWLYSRGVTLAAEAVMPSRAKNQPEITSNHNPFGLQLAESEPFAQNPAFCSTCVISIQPPNRAVRFHFVFNGLLATYTDNVPGGVGLATHLRERISKKSKGCKACINQ
jgi:hypothetical protein